MTFLLWLFTIIIVLQLLSAKPNFVLFLCDDLGYGEVNAHDFHWAFPINPIVPGSPPVDRADLRRVLPTPNLARLAKQGIRLSMSYSPSSVCAPSRASLFSEIHVGGSNVRGNWKAETSPKPKNFVRLLFDNGYSTGYFGKWGLGIITGAPWNYGFQTFLGQLDQTEAHTVFPPNLIYYNSSIRKQIPMTEDQVDQLRIPLLGNAAQNFNEENCPRNPSSSCTYINDVVRDAAFNFIQSHTSSSSPFFVVFAPTYPHASQYNLKDARNRKKFLAAVKREVPNRFLFDEQVYREHAAQIVEHLDKDVGSLLDLLESDTNLDMNTFVIFTSDNGAHNDGYHYDYEFFTSSGGLRGHKRDIYEGGLRSPTILRFKGTFPEGTISRVPTAHYDFGATILEAAGIDAPIRYGQNGEPGGGMSMYKVWKSGNEQDAPKREWLQMEFCKEQVESNCLTSTILTSNWNSTTNEPLWKLIVFGKKKVLYDLRHDPTETNPIEDKNVIKKLLNIRNSIRTRYTKSK